MASRDDEIKDLKEKNNELVQKVQYWKMTAGQRENEKLALMKEINELRLKLSRLRSTGGVQARNFEAAIQAASERALSHLVHASGEIAHTIELSKSYMRDRQELDASSPRWSAISGTPSTEKTERVHRVPPMMMGGQSIQPVVALSRTLFNTNSSRPAARSPNQNRSITERAVPMHMLQDVYIPLTRVDAGDRLANNSEPDSDAQDEDNSTDDLGLEDSGERLDDSQEASGTEDFEVSRRLDAVTEDIEPEDEVQTPPRKIDNPLEGPSWLLDSPESAKSIRGKSRVNLEPDSTTEVDEEACTSSPHTQPVEAQVGVSACPRSEFTPTVRHRKRVCSPLSPRTPRSPRNPPARRISNSGRVLKVMVAKMRLSGGEEDSSGASPPKRCAPAPPALASPAQLFARFDAPSPNGATDAALLVSEATTPEHPLDNTTDQIRHRRDSRLDRIERSSMERRRNDHTDQERPARPQDLDRPSRPNDHERRPHGDLERRPHGTGHESKSNETDHERRPHGTDHERSRPHSGDHDHRRTSTERGSRAGSETSLLSSDSRDSEGDPAREGRTRRPRKPVTYKEKPLNRKLRR